MTQVSTAKIDVSMFDVSDIYPDSIITDAIEERIAASLPPIAGLVAGLSAGARLAVYEASISSAREVFISQYGGPYGCVAMQVVVAPEVFDLQAAGIVDI